MAPVLDICDGMVDRFDFRWHENVKHSLHRRQGSLKVSLLHEEKIALTQKIA